MSGLASVVAVNLIVWTGVWAYLLWIHKKLKDLERDS